LLAHFDGLVLEAYNGWSSRASTDLFEINVLLIIADDPFSCLQRCRLGVFRPGTLFNDITGVGILQKLIVRNKERRNGISLKEKKAPQFPARLY
jgi:hypothetical protein